ncbi:MAG: protein kinase [Polyangiaceae bacterium]|nr:protein kinase [Polyangiaceae bacterium]
MTIPSIAEPGTILAGKYQVERVLGVGGMGIVVAAKHLQLEQTVAIKFLLPAALANPEFVARFAREARAASKIRGEHVTRVIDVGQFDDGSPFMVMEYLEGNDLAKELQLQGPMPVVDAVRYILETCEALSEAHAAKIVHRDLKPSNLFLANRPGKRSIKVLDFGISKIGDSPPSQALTKTSELMGTVFYMSPEQLRTPKAVDSRSDIWSLGVILYELLAGRPPFLGETVPEILVAILANEPEPLTQHRPDVPEGLVRVTAQCMQLNAADRFANVARLAQALEPYASPADRESVQIAARVLGETAAPSTQSNASSPAISLAPLLPTANMTSAAPVVAASTAAGVATPTEAPRAAKRSRLLVGGVVAGVAVALGVTAFFARRPPPTPEPVATSAAAPETATATPTPSASAMTAATSESAALDASLIDADATTAATASSTKAPAPPKPVNARAASAASAPSASAISAKPAAPAGQPTSANPKKNPMNMGIK